MQRIAVIGLGRFGMAVAMHLAESRTQVIAIDTNDTLVDEVKDSVDIAVRLDSTDERALISQGIDQVDVAVVGMGEDFESALLTTVILTRFGIPRIICRAQTEFHEQIFRQVGATDVIQPERETGHHLARKLANPHLEDYITVGEGVTLIELVAPASFVGKTLLEIDLRKKHQVNLVAIKRQRPAVEGEESAEMGRQILSVPRTNDLIQDGDSLLLIGSDEALARLPKE